MPRLNSAVISRVCLSILAQRWLALVLRCRFLCWLDDEFCSAVSLPLFRSLALWLGVRVCRLRQDDCAEQEEANASNRLASNRLNPLSVSQRFVYPNACSAVSNRANRNWHRCNHNLPVSLAPISNSIAPHFVPQALAVHVFVLLKARSELLLLLGWHVRVDCYVA